MEIQMRNAQVFAHSILTSHPLETGKQILFVYEDIGDPIVALVGCKSKGGLVSRRHFVIWKVFDSYINEINTLRVTNATV